MILPYYIVDETTKQRYLISNDKTLYTKSCVQSIIIFIISLVYIICCCIIWLYYIEIDLMWSVIWICCCLTQFVTAGFNLYKTIFGPSRNILQTLDLSQSGVPCNARYPFQHSSNTTIPWASSPPWVGPRSSNFFLQARQISIYTAAIKRYRLWSTQDPHPKGIPLPIRHDPPIKQHIDVINQEELNNPFEYTTQHNTSSQNVTDQEESTSHHTSNHIEYGTQHITPSQDDPNSFFFQSTRRIIDNYWRIGRPAYSVVFPTSVYEYPRDIQDKLAPKNTTTKTKISILLNQFKYQPLLRLQAMVCIISALFLLISQFVKIGFNMAVLCIAISGLVTALANFWKCMSFYSPLLSNNDVEKYFNDTFPDACPTPYVL